MSKQTIYNLNDDLSDDVEFSDAEQIELILEEANGYSLRWEVKSLADKYKVEDPELSELDATIMAYSEWIK